MRDGLLNETMFRSPVHARAVSADRVTDRNTQRPRSAFAAGRQPALRCT